MRIKTATINSRIARLQAAFDASILEIPSVFGIVNSDKRVIKKLELTPRGLYPTRKTPNVLIPQKLEKLLHPKRFKIIFGGRGSGKTRTIGAILVQRARINYERIASFRELMKSIEVSSYRAFVDEIRRKDLENEYSITNRGLSTRKTRSLFSFSGLRHNDTALKGMEGLTIAWVDEAENISSSSWEALRPTIRDSGSELWVSFNPRYATDPTWLELVAPYYEKMVGGIYEDENFLIIECNHSDNPWLTDELKLERDLMAERDPDKYRWVWEGKFYNRSHSQIFHGKWSICDFKTPRSVTDFYHGCDFGFANDPSAFTRCWIHDNCLYIDFERGGIKLTTEQLADLIRDVASGLEHEILCDRARPETISQLVELGINALPANKWSGSVEDGIEFIRGFKHIYIHPRCQEVIREFSTYSYKVNKLTDQVLPVVEDKNNHYIDSIRYGLSKLIQKKPKFIFG